MNLAETLRGLRRRWYIVLPGIIVACALAFGAWTTVRPGYERTATQLLLPGTDSVPEGGNPYLFIGGLTQAADVVVRAVGSDNVLEGVAADYPGAEVQVSRDPSTAGPVILITVTANSDDEAAAMLEDLVAQTAVVLDHLQDEEDIGADNRITVTPITVDEQSVLQQKNRMVMAALVGVGGIVLTLLLAALVDGLVVSRRRHRSGAVDTVQAATTEADPLGPSDDEAPESVESDSSIEHIETASPATQPVKLPATSVRRSRAGKTAKQS